jgi:hypothetical protein
MIDVHLPTTDGPHGSPHLSVVMDEEIEPGGRHRFGGKA